MSSKTTWTWHHLTIFALTFFGYALFHGCRKSWSNVKDSLEKEITPRNETNPTYPLYLWEERHVFRDLSDADIFAGVLDTLFLFAYAIGLYVSGIIGDRINLRYLLSGGMMLSAISMLVFGYITEVVGFRNKYFYGTVYFACGLFQSTGWPATVAIMGNWFGRNKSGLVFGIWSANASVGNIIGALLVSSVLDYGYEYGMLVNSYMLFCGGIVIFLCLYPSPSDVGLRIADEDDESNIPIEQEKLLQENADHETSVVSSHPQAISLLGAILLPGVIPYSLAYACLKLVNYSFFFWLPVYLDQGLHWSDKLSDRLSNFFDIGGITGGIVAGITSDLLHKRSPVMIVFLVGAMLSLYWYSIVGPDYKLNVAVMTLCGFLIGGPANIISSAITADLGKQVGVEGNKQALATVTGIVDGTGSVGAAIGQLLVPVIAKKANWHYVFYFLIVMGFLSIMCLTPMLYKEVRDWVKKKRSNGVHGINNVRDFH